MKASAFTAVLCDLDGVLVDSNQTVIRTWRRFAIRHHLSLELVEQTIHGRPAPDSVRLLAPASDVEVEVALVDQWELDDTTDVTPLPGASELAALLGERFAVVTSCSHPLAIARLDSAGLPTPMVLVTRETVSRGKPDPECYLVAAAALGVQPDECAVIEDSPVGIAAGRAAGATTIGVTTTFPAEALATADVVVPTIAEALWRFTNS